MVKKTNDKSEPQVTEVDPETIKNALSNLQGLTESHDIIAEQGLAQENVVYDMLFKAYANAIMGEKTLDYPIFGEHPISLENIELLKQMGVYDSELVVPADEETGTDTMTHYYLGWGTDQSGKETKHED